MWKVLENGTFSKSKTKIVLERVPKLVPKSVIDPPLQLEMGEYCLSKMNQAARTVRSKCGA